MSDIILCGNAEKINCPLRLKCKRYLNSLSNGKDSTFKDFDYYANSCNGFWEEETIEDVFEHRHEEAVEHIRQIWG